MAIGYQKQSQSILNYFKTARSVPMPLVKGAKARTKQGFSKNVKAEMKAGKPQNQAVAIAYSQAGENKKPKKKKFWKD